MRKPLSDAYYLVFLFFTYIVLLLVMPGKGFDYDMWCWMEWSRHLQVVGMQNAYTVQVENGLNINYPPLWLYILNVYGYCCGNADAIGRYSFVLKDIAFSFEFASVLVVFFICKKFGFPRYFVFFLLLNPAFLYNAYFWGQVDGMFTFFVALSILFIATKRSAWSIIMFVLAVYTKFQAIIFLPMIGLLLLPLWKSKPAYIFRDLLVLIIANCIILLPFLVTGNIASVFNVLTGSVGYYPFITMNAYNIWYLIKPGLHSGMPDNEMLGPLNYRNWGLFLFFLSSFIVLFPLLRNAVLALRGRIINQIPYERIAFIAGVIPLVFFYFNTQMHERYSHPAILFLFYFGLFSKKFLPYIFLSLAYFLNMEDVLRLFHINHKTVPFDPRFIAGLYSVVVLLCARYLLTLNHENKFVKAENVLV